MSDSSDPSSLVDPATVGQPDQRPTILVLGIVFPILAILATVARFRARVLKGVGFGADDWTCLAALIVTIGVCIDIVLDAELGNLGWHTQFDEDGIPLFNNTFDAFGKTTFALEILVWPAVGLTKISILLLYKRIFGTSKRFRILVWSMIGLAIAWTFTFTMALIFSCWPIQGDWDPTIDSVCVNQPLLFTWALATDVVTDGLILLLPVYKVWKLQLPLARKISIIAIFMLGGLVTITGIIRIHFLTLVYDALSKPAFDDVAYAYAPPFYWSIIESCTGVVCACLPTMMPLLEKYRLNTLGSRLLSSFGRSSGSKSTDYKYDNSQRTYENLPPQDKNNTSKSHFYSNIFTTKSKNDASSFNSDTQLTDIRQPKTAL